MKLPRWTVYPALGVLALFLVTAVPRRTERPPRLPRVVVLGIDGMDPEILAETIELFPEGMTSFRRHVGEGGLHSLATSCPPQSPVAWSSFITGLDPGGHGIFDFIHRDPVRRVPVPSTTKAVADDSIGLFGDWEFPLTSGGGSNRTGEAFWSILARHGVPADIWRMPANFPVEPAEGLSFPGMMTPALDSAYGEFTFYTTDPPVDTGITGGKIEPVREFDGQIVTRVIGPPNPFKHGHPPVTVPVVIYVDRGASACAIDTGEEVLVLRAGEWSDFTEVTFRFLPSLLALPFDLASAGTGSVKGTLRFYLRRVEPEFELYASPVNIDPLAPPGAAPVSAPAEASAELAEAIGLYYTQGMPEDVSALKTEVLGDEEFMAQSDLVHEEGLRMLDYALDHYLANERGGLLFFYFSGVDLCSHMMWRHADPDHPHHDPAFAERDSARWSGREGSRWKDVIHDLYLRMDPVLGRIRERVGDDALVIVMSDHGFAPYRRKFNLNTWLLEQGYLVLKPGFDPAQGQVHVSEAADWSRTRAYGIGFNALYLNLAGREADDPETPEDESGIVAAADAGALLAEIRSKLEALVDVDGARVVLRCDLAADVYRGERRSEAPDLLVGYNAGYGNSDPASLGRIGANVLEDNLGGTFNGSHLMAPEVVPGVLLSTGEVRDGDHGLVDLTVEILGQYGIEPGSGMRGHRVLR